MSAIGVAMHPNAQLPAGVVAEQAVAAAARGARATGAFSEVYEGQPGSTGACIVVVIDLEALPGSAVVRLTRTIPGQPDEHTSGISGSDADPSRILEMCAEQAWEFATPERYEELLRATGATGDLRHPRIKDADPARISLLIVAAAINGQREAVGQHGRRLLDHGLRTDDVNAVLLGSECAFLVGAPMRDGPALLDKMMALPPQHPLVGALRTRVGGLRAAATLGVDVLRVLVRLGRLGTSFRAGKISADSTQVLSDAFGRLANNGLLLAPNPLELSKEVVSGAFQTRTSSALGGAVSKTVHVLAALDAVVDGYVPWSDVQDTLAELVRTTTLVCTDLFGAGPGTAFVAAVAEGAADAPAFGVSLADEALRQDVYFADPGFAVAINHLRQQQIPAAEEAITAVLNRHPTSCEALRLRANFRMMQGRNEQAFEDLTAAIAARPDTESLVLRGGMLVDAAQLDDAVAELSRAVEMDAANAKARMFRARAFKLVGDLESAQSDARVAAFLGVGDPTVLGFLRANGFIG